MLVTCLANPAEVPQCIHKLASTTFVQAVESPELAMMAPLLLKGLSVQQTTPIKRKSALIVDNMAKVCCCCCCCCCLCLLQQQCLHLSACPLSQQLSFAGSSCIPACRPAS